MMAQLKQQARQMLTDFKHDRYVYGLGCVDQLGTLVTRAGGPVALVLGGLGKDWGSSVHAQVLQSLHLAKVATVGEPIAGCRPNAPYEDVRRIAGELAQRSAETVLVVGGGSVIDAVKAALALSVLGNDGGEFEPFFGMGKVSALLEARGKALPRMVAVQLAASSAAHLTKYANVTDMAAAQKKLIIDDALIPPLALFDYRHSVSMSSDFTADGALDGLSHCLEVFYGAKGSALERIGPVARTGMELIVGHVRAACHDGGNLTAREALGLGTDLGGYAIMIGGTNGAHLTSFSLVDLLPHGRACALMNPYYTVFFAPAIQPQLRDVASTFRRAGLLKASTEHLHGRELGIAVADAMIELSREIRFPTRLADVPGFTPGHVERALAAAKNSQLASKLQNMPVPMAADMVDEYMGPVLAAATAGDFSLIKNVQR